MGPPAKRGAVARQGLRVKLKYRAMTALFLFQGIVFSFAGDGMPGNDFIYAQLKHNGQWDPYPSVWEQIGPYLRQTTSLSPKAERRVVAAGDPLFFQSPFVAILGRGAVSFSDQDLSQLRTYLSGGGFVFVDNSEAERNGPFARSVLPAIEKLFPGAAWETLPSDHAVYRAFFLLRAAAGRRVVDSEFKALKIQGRVAAVYCGNDLHGAWARDPLGHPLYVCEPGGEPQRQEAVKNMVNIALFSVTGTYKTDAIHQPFIERKLGQ